MALGAGEGRGSACFLVMSTGLGCENIPSHVRGEERPLSPCVGLGKNRTKDNRRGRHRWWVKALSSLKRVL